MKLTIEGFAGASKALHPKLLPDRVGEDSQNQKPGRGDLRPWNQPLTVATVPSGSQSIYRFGRDTATDANYWFAWTTIVHAVRGYNQDDTTERTYLTGFGGEPKWTDNTIALATPPYPTATRHLGVPPPTSPVSLSASGGTSPTTETRFYTITFVTNLSEESAPGPISLQLTCKSDDTVTISSIPPAPVGSFTINRVRIYRTEAGESTADFFFLREIAAGVTSTTDDNRALGEPLQTTTWEQPPGDLSYLTAMWNGMLAGISGTGVRFCEPFAPYAWPPEYEVLPPDAKPVALARWQQNLLVLTTARPLLLVGTSPDNLDQQPIDFAQPCVAPNAVVSFGHGVAWPCPDGLAYVGSDGPRLLTTGIFTRDDWQALNPSTMVASVYAGAYVCFYTDGTGQRRGFVIDPLNPTGVYFLSAWYDAAYFDELQGKLYVLSTTNTVQKWDAGAAAMTATFKSKVFTTTEANFAALRVTADQYPVTVTVDAGPFTSAELIALTAAIPGTSANGTFLRCASTVTSSDAVRLPSGFAATAWQVTVDTTGPVQLVELATSMTELRESV